MEKSIISEREPIYDSGRAHALLVLKKKKPRELSMMKQRNFKEAIKKRMGLVEIRGVVGELCGFCFKYNGVRCPKCPIVKKKGKECHEFPEYVEMRNATTYKELSKAHKSWCKKIGLDVYKKSQ